MFFIFLILIFIRPFISSMAFPYLNFIYSILLFIGTIIWLLNKKRGLNKIQLPKYPIMLFILALCFSIVFSQDKLNGLQEFHTCLIGIGLGNLNIPFSLYAHNSYLQLWAETGIAGLASFLWLITALLLSANIIFLLHNLVDFTFFLPEISLIWWIILGLNLPLLSLPAFILSQSE